MRVLRYETDDCAFMILLLRRWFSREMSRCFSLSETETWDFIDLLDLFERAESTRARDTSNAFVRLPRVFGCSSRRVAILKRILVFCLQIWSYLDCSFLRKAAWRC